MRAEHRSFPQAFQVGASSRGREVVFGPHRVPLSDIVSVEYEEVSERHLTGLVVVTIGFGLFALLLLILVGDYGWRSRFLVGVGFLALLAVASVSELFTLKRLTYRRYMIRLKDGREVEFATPDLAMAYGFEQAIQGNRPATMTIPE